MLPRSPRSVVATLLLLALAASGCDRKDTEAPTPDAKSAPTAPPETAPAAAANAPETAPGGDGSPAPTAGSDDGSGIEPVAAPAPRPPVPRQAEPVPRAVDVNELLVLRQKLGMDPLPPLAISDLLTRVDLRELARYSGTLTDAPLPGIDPEPNYNALRFATDDDGFGIALQVWHVDEDRKLLPRYNRLRETWIDARPERPPVGEQAFSGEFEGLLHYTFLHRASRNIVALTCEKKVCTADALRKLAERVLSRI